MKLINIGTRTFMTSHGNLEPMGIIEVPKDEAEKYLGYTGEIKALEEEAPAIKPEVVTENKTETKTKKKGK